MSTKYNDLDLTTFPDQIDAQQIMKDPTKDQLVSILAYETMLRSGDYDDAAAFLSSHPELAEMQITAEKMNRHEQMIIAIERMFKEDIDNYINEVRGAVTEELEAKVETALSLAQTASSTAISANTTANNMQTQLLTRTKNVVKEVAKKIFSISGNANWSENDKGLFEYALDLNGVTASSRVRYSISENNIGSVFIAGVVVPENNKLKVISFNKPESGLTIEIRVEEVVS